MKVSRITVTVLALALLAGPAMAGLTFNWVLDPPYPPEKATVTDPKLGNDGFDSQVAWTSGPAKTADYNGSLNDFTFTTLALPGAGVGGGPVTQVNSVSVPNSNGYYVVGKTIAAPDPMNGAWAYTSAGWTQLAYTYSVTQTVTDSNEDYAVMHSQNGYGGVKVVSLNTGVPVLTALPNQFGEAGNGRISDNGDYVVYSSNGWLGSRIHYGANWASYTTLGDGYPDPGDPGMTYAYDVNNSGNVVGYSQEPGDEGPLFYNFATTTFSDIPEGPFTGKTLRPKYINNLNQVVGTVNGNEDLFYYDYASNTTVNLWDLVDGETGSNPQVGPNWIAWHAAQYIGGINDLGWITGTVTGELAWGGGGPAMNAFLLTPEPATLMVLLAGGLAGLVRRRR